MVQQVVLTPSAARAIARDHEQLRRFPRNVQTTPPLPDNRARIQRRVSAIAKTDDTIAMFDGATMKAPSGNVKMLDLQDDGSLSESGEILKAYNMLACLLFQGQIVELTKHWRTGRWMIVGNLGLARRIYFKGLGSFGTGSATFPAQLVNIFDGVDPRGIRWSVGGTDNVINPPTATGEHFFQGTSGVYGYAVWHDSDPITPGAPAGYWCDQLQCAVG
jgi:hypothetical protein